jgi:hypothetical protein
MDIRMLNAFPALLELLNSEHPEIVENALHCLIKSSEDGKA